MRTRDDRLRRLRSMGASPEQESLSVNGYVAVQRFRSDDTRFILLWIKCDSSWCLVAVDRTVDSRVQDVGP